MGQIAYQRCFAAYVSNMIVELTGIDALNIGKVIASVDLGVGGRACMLVGMAGGSDRFHVLYEYYDDGGGLVELLERQDALDALKPEQILIGNDANTRSVIDGVTAREVLEERGFEVAAVGGSLRRGIARIRSLVTTDPGFCDLTIAPRCGRLISDLRHVEVKPASGDGLEYVSKDASHSVDALRYFVSQQLVTSWVCV